MIMPTEWAVHSAVTVRTVLVTWHVTVSVYMLQLPSVVNFPMYSTCEVNQLQTGEFVLCVIIMKMLM